MRNLRQALMAVAVLTAALAIGATVKKTAPASTAHLETATLAGGCFWGLQATLRQIPGVIKTTVGYTGGMTSDPTYEQVASGKTGHTEAVEVMFDPAKLSYETLLTDFLIARNPARQINSTNSPHRSTIFYHNEGQRQSAERVKGTINQSGQRGSPVLTEINPALKFYPAEEYHQDYYQKSASDHACELGAN